LCPFSPEELALRGEPGPRESRGRLELGAMGVLERLAEHFSSTWKLLSETNKFLAKTSLMGHYETEFTAMRARLKSHEHDRETIMEIKDRVIQIRKGLRLGGYDLTLADFDLVISDYRNDSSARTYTRMVMFIGDGRIWSVSGEANHETLFGYLDAEPHGNVEHSHCLWYRWEGMTLFVSGSDSEDQASFEALKSWSDTPENRLMLLRHMKDRRR